MEKHELLKELSKLSVDEVYELAHQAHRHIEARASLNFVKGMVVEFETRDGETKRGTVKYVNQRTCSVDADGKPWRVSFQFLRPVMS